MSEHLSYNMDNERKGVIRPDGTYAPRDKPINFESFINQAVDDVAYKSVNPDVESKSQIELSPHQSNTDPRLEDEINQFVGEESRFYTDYAREAGGGDWLTREKLAYNTQVKYLQFLGYQSQDKTRPAAERQVWADEFTKLSTEIYGAPDRDVAKIIDAGAGEKIIEKYQPVLNEVKSYLETKYEVVFSALDLDSRTEKLNVEQIFSVFTKGLDALKTEDSRWADWQVVMGGGTVLECDAAKKQIIVGEKRTDADPKKLKGLFAHEVLVHANRAVNAADLNIDSALPRYVMAEEGLAKICEISLSGESLKTSMQNYADMAYALGLLDGQKHTRSEVIERKLSRKKVVDDKATTAAQNSAARLFRGTPGSDEVSGVFTKDVSYFGGFVPIAGFIEAGLSKRQNIGEIMDYLLSAKFDPNNPDHANFMGEKLNERYLPKPPTEIVLQ